MHPVTAAAGLETALEPAVVATVGPEPPRPNEHEPERTPVAAAMCRMDPEGTVAVAAVQEPAAAAAAVMAAAGCWQRNGVADKD